MWKPARILGGAPLSLGISLGVILFSGTPAPGQAFLPGADPGRYIHTNLGKPSLPSFNPFGQSSNGGNSNLEVVTLPYIDVNGRAFSGTSNTGGTPSYLGQASPWYDPANGQFWWHFVYNGRLLRKRVPSRDAVNIPSQPSGGQGQLTVVNGKVTTKPAIIHWGGQVPPGGGQFPQGGGQFPQGGGGQFPQGGGGQFPQGGGGQFPQGGGQFPGNDNLNQGPPGVDPNQGPPGVDPNQGPPGVDPNQGPPGVDSNQGPPGVDPSQGPGPAGNLPAGLYRVIVVNHTGYTLSVVTKFSDPDTGTWIDRGNSQVPDGQAVDLGVTNNPSTVFLYASYIDNGGNVGPYVSGNDATFDSPSGPVGMLRANFTVVGDTVGTSIAPRTP